MSGDDSHPKNGFNDVIGIALLALALLLLVAQLSFDRNDISFLTTRLNKPIHNWIGLLGAWLAWGSFTVVGAAAYVVPWLFGIFGAAYLLNFMGYLRERLRWSLLWVGVLMISLTGVFHMLDDGSKHGKFHEVIGTASAGGMLGKITFGQTTNYDYGFCLLGNLGATIVYTALGLIALLFLTNFRLGDWIRTLLQREKSAEEITLERRAPELEKQKRKIEPEIEKVASGLGADGLPVPEPTVRDLSYPQAKGPRVSKTTLPPKTTKEVAPSSEPVEVGEVIPASEIRPATSDEILGRKSEANPAEKKPVEEAKSEPIVAEKVEAPAEENPAEPKPEPVIIIADGSTPPVPTPRLKPAPRKPKPMTVASVPMIGNYQLPPMDFLQHADMTLKPTESKEELMANARLMQATLAQFDIEVSLGDITKGPTITRYELHPAPGVKLEKITALSNNIAAALKAERIHILAPVPGKSSVGVEVPNLIKTKVIMRDLFESDEWRNTKARIPIALGKDVYGHPIVADLAEMPHCLIAGSTGSGKSVCINSIIASLLYRFSPDQLRFVMIDPKVVELQQYNALPHLLVPVVTDPK